MNELRNNFNKAVKAYLDALHKQFDWSACYGYWVSDDTTGVYAYEDAYFLSLADVIYIVDNKVTVEELDEWNDYVLWAHEFYQRCPTLEEYRRGFRLSDDERKHLEALKKRFIDEVERCKELY